MKSEWVYLRHILDEIEFIRSIRATMTFEDLTKDPVAEHAITRALEIIGEATKNIPEPLKKENPEVPWREMAGLRDRIVHKYFQIDYSIVWRVITEDLPVIEPEIQAIYTIIKS